MNKRIITVILSIVMMLSAIGVNTSAVESADDTQSAVQFLEDLGIITSEISDAGSMISREEFAVYVARMLNIDVNDTQQVRYFVDVENDGYAVGAINALVDLGLISVGDDREFRPQDGVTMAEAAKILVCALGYKEVAEYEGGYPAGYSKIAARIGIMANAQNTEGVLSYGNAFIMICNALEAQLLTVEVIGEDGTYIEYDRNGEHSVLKDIWKIEESYGMVTSVFGATANTSVIEESNQIRIDDVLYTLPNGFDSSKYFGEYVRFYYKIQDSNYDREIVSIAREGRVKNIEIAPKSFKGVDGKSISYSDESGRVKTVELEQTLFVYNGYPLKSDVSAKLSGINKGSIVIKDGNGNGKFDIAIISDYANFIVSSASNGMIYDKLGSAPIDTNTYKSCKISTVDGVASIADIQAGQSLSVARSANNENIEIIISNKQVSGVISESKVADGKYVITVESQNYTIEKSYAQVIKDTYLANVPWSTTFTFTIDAFGYVVYMTGQTSSMNSGFIIRGYAETTGLSSTAKLQILTKSHTFDVLELADKVKINDTSYTDPIKAYENIPGNTSLNGNLELKRQLIRYTLDSEGKINRIVTAAYDAWGGNTDAGFLQIYDRDKEFRYTRGRLGAAGTFTTATKIYMLPSGVTDFKEEDCAVTTYASLIEDEVYPSGNAYIFEETGVLADAAVVYYTPTQVPKNRLYTKSIMMVTAVTEKLGQDDEIVSCVEGYSNGSKIEVLVPDEFSVSGIEEGDIVMFDYDLEGNVAGDYTMLCDRSNVYENNKPGWTSNSHHEYLYMDSSDKLSDYYRAVFQLSFGQVNRVSGTGVAWDYDFDGKFDETADISGNVVIYDSSRRENDRIYVGKAQDILSYETVGANCAKIVFRTRGQVYVESFIYQ